MKNPSAKSNLILLLNFLAFTLSFAAWMINGVLVAYLTNMGVYDWSVEQIGILLGVPVLVGSVMRLPVGMLTDKFGGKVIMSAVLLLSAIPMFFLSKADSYEMFLLLSFGFGLSGSTFASGVAYVSVWFPKHKQGTALGIFGTGNIGAALTTMLAPTLLNKLTNNQSNIEAWRYLPQIYAAVLVFIAIVFLLFVENKKPDTTKSFTERILPLKQTRVWRFGLYYFFVFGGFVSLTQWLIPYYLNVYSMTIVAAGLMTTIFNLPAGLIRAVGGIIADKIGARKVMFYVFGISMVFLVLLFIPRVEVQTPGQGIIASKSGKVEDITLNEIIVVSETDTLEKVVYPLLSKEKSSQIFVRFGIGNTTEKFLLLPSSVEWHESLVEVGDNIEKGQLLAKGITYIYFQANKWIFTLFVFIVGIMMGIGSAAVFKHIPDYYPADVGTVGGIVGVLGGLGGFFGPIIFSYILKLSGVWTTCWMFLFVIALIGLLWKRHSVKRGDN